MKHTRLFIVLNIGMILTLLLAGCGTKATPTQVQVQPTAVPPTEVVPTTVPPAAAPPVSETKL